ncbi:MAG TPA: ATP-binding cassette domain-containing protein [Acidisphaera sp.]|nr:ATP-binding cassette domain-containing protein [Acidisphaera sp.]
MLEARIAAKRLPSGETLLHDVALAAAPGDIVALLGASGAGKTTTLRILLGLDRSFDGDLRCRAARIGAVFQEPALLPWRTVGDNIRLVTHHAAPTDIAALLRDVGLPEAEALYPRQLSLGMRRRAAVARALAVDPDLLVLDEPFASLDPRMAGLIAERLAVHVRTRGAAIVVAMHDIDRATAFATRILVLSGRPATVAARLELPADASDADRAAIRARLLDSFGFLADAPAAL